MIKISTRNIFILVVVGGFFMFLWALYFFSLLDKEAYFNDFKEDSIDKLEIIISLNPTGQKVTISTDKDEEIEYFRNMLLKKLNGNEREIQHKEGKVYDYNVYLKFYNKSGTDIYKFTVYTDAEKIKIRPVILKDRGESIPGGFSYNLQDDDFKFYDDIFKIWSYKEIKI